MHQQLSQHLASHSVLEGDLERVQAELEEQLVHNEVLSASMCEAKEYAKSLGVHMDSFDQRQKEWLEEKQNLLKRADEDRARWKEERSRLLQEKGVLAKQKAEMEERSRAQTTISADWPQKQSELEAEKAAWAAEKLEWLEKEKLWTAEKDSQQGWNDERERLEAAVKSAEKDNDFFRTQYSTASSFADSVRVENIQLQKQNDEFKQQAAIAHGQAKHGVQLIRDTYGLRVKKLEEELEKTRRLCDLLKTKDERTNDEVRRLAASYPELEENYQRLQTAWTRATGSPFREDEEYEFELNASLEYPEDEPQLQEGDDDEVYTCMDRWCGFLADTPQVIFFCPNFWSRLMLAQDLRNHCAISHDVRKLNLLFP